MRNVNNNKLKYVLGVISTSIILLAGCGGGGSDSPPATASSSSSSSVQASPVFAFSKNGSFDLFIDDNFSNPAVSSSGKSITYTSSDTSVATVDSSGKVTCLSLGSVIITATEAADTNAVSQTLTYSIHVLPTAPGSLNNMRLTLSVNDTVPKLDAYPPQGDITDYFSSERYVENGDDSFIGWLYGTYSLEGVVDGKLQKKSNVLVIKKNVQWGTVKTELVFTAHDSGTFTQSYLAPQGSFAHKGRFNLKQDAFNILPPNLFDQTLEFNVQKILSDQAATASIAVGEKLTLTFSKNTSVNFLNSKDKSTCTANYQATTSNLYDVVISGTYTNSQRVYQFKLTFDTFFSGTYTFLLDDDKAVASGNFNLTHNNNMVITSLKGTVIEGKNIASSYTGINYPYTIYLPPGYESSGKQYPVVYLTDGQWASDLYYITDQKNKDIILVLIHQGPNDRRMIDYSPVGADKYIQFIKKELVPKIEADYSTNHERTYMGGSLGGLVGAVLLADEPVGTAFFKNYILVDGTMWWYLPSWSKQEIDRYNASHSMNVNLCVSSTRQGNITSVENFVQRYTDRHYEGMKIETFIYPVAHVEMSYPAFRECIELFFPAQ